jgi:hypothetical protein
VQSDDPVWVGASRERVSDCSFGNGTLVERRFMLRRRLDGDQQTSNLGMRFQGASFAVALATRASTRPSGPQGTITLGAGQSFLADAGR